jgi:hypothetical protein
VFPTKGRTTSTMAPSFTSVDSRFSCEGLGCSDAVGMIGDSLGPHSRIDKAPWAAANSPSFCASCE